MVNVVDLNDFNIKQCKYCGSFVKYDKTDKKSDYECGPWGTEHWEYIICPKCKQQIQF